VSIDAGTPPAEGNGAPPPEPAPRRGLRDRALGRLALLGLVLLAAVLSTRACGEGQRNVSNEEAIELAKAEASFEPCAEPQCAQARYLQRGIPPRAYWGVVLWKAFDAQGVPTLTEDFLVDAITGDVTEP
jgi:hypothetical protein